MLIEFNVANFRSFWEEQSLKMTANTKPELKETNTFNSGVKGIPRLMRSACIYGPNASGKSNLVLAMKFMQNFVLSSAKESQEGELIGLKPFLFNKMGMSAPSVFEVHFVQDGVRYQYGFSATNERVYDEWLMAYPEGKAQRWFERTYDPEKEEEKWYFGGKFLGSKIVWQNATRKNALFLSTASQVNNDQLKPFFSWFKRLLVVEHGALLHPGFSIERCEDEKGKEEILAFMNAADLSIEDIKFETFGCAAAIAVTSAMTDMAKGKTLDEALAITKSDIVEDLGGLPNPKIHCSMLGVDALYEAIKNYQKVNH